MPRSNFCWSADAHVRSSLPPSRTDADVGVRAPFAVVSLGNTLAAGLRACEGSAMQPARHFAFNCGLALLLGALTVSAQSSSTNKPAPPASTKAATAATTKAAPPAPTGTFDDFKAIPDRNIFNTRRLAGRTATSEAPAPVRRERVVETVSLLGTMQYEKGRIAFFEGSSSSSKKSVQVDETIAGCKITAIEPSAVTVEANGKPLELKVGYMLRREDDGAWETRLADRPMDYGSSSSYSSSSPFGSSSSFGSSSRFGSSSSFGGSSFSSSPFSRDSRSSSSSSRFGGGSSPQEYAQTRLREQDRNNDGRISREEADSRLRDRFREIDRNSDGYVDGEEYTNYYITRMGGSTSTSSSPSPFGGSSFSPSAPSSGSPFGSSSTGIAPFGGSSSSSSAPPPSTGSSSSGGAGESDLLRRLMEQRARDNR